TKAITFYQFINIFAFSLNFNTVIQVYYSNETFLSFQGLIFSLDLIFLALFIRYFSISLYFTMIYFVLIIFVFQSHVTTLTKHLIRETTKRVSSQKLAA